MKYTMMWLNYSGIIVLYILMVNGQQKDCLVDNIHGIEPWIGKEVTFFAYVLENDVVEINITYSILGNDSFTTLNFSYKTRYSKRIEIKNGIKSGQYPLPSIKNVNDWVEFTISSEERGKLYVIYEQNTHVDITINQTSTSVEGLNIKASNLSLCKHERRWRVTPSQPAYIPLGIKQIPGNIDLNFYLVESDSVPILKIYDWGNAPPEERCFTFLITIENNNAIHQCKKEINAKNMLVIISENLDFFTSITFGAAADPHLIESPYEPVTEYCTLCSRTWEIVAIVMIVILILVGFAWLVNNWKEIDNFIKGNKNQQQSITHSDHDVTDPAQALNGITHSDHDVTDPAQALNGNGGNNP